MYKEGDASIIMLEGGGEVNGVPLPAGHMLHIADGQHGGREISVTEGFDLETLNAFTLQVIKDNRDALLSTGAITHETIAKAEVLIEEAREQGKAGEVEDLGTANTKEDNTVIIPLPKPAPEEDPEDLAEDEVEEANEPNAQPTASPRPDPTSEPSSEPEPIATPTPSPIPSSTPTPTPTPIPDVPSIPTPPPGPPGGENGEPFRISTVEHLEWINEPGHDERFSANYKLESDITAPRNFIIGAAINGKEFRGNFDGGGHTITLDINTPSADNVGLFAFLERNAVVENLVVGGKVTARDYVGGIAGRMLPGSRVMNSVSEVEVTGASRVGGITGWSRGRIEQVYAIGNITGDANSSYLSQAGHYVGGIVGYNDQGAFISNVYSTGNITGVSNVGGIVGAHASGSNILSAYSTSIVKANSNYAGGIAGYNLGNISNSAALNPTVDGSIGSVGRVTFGSSVNGNVRARDDMLLNGVPLTGNEPNNTNAQNGNTVYRSEIEPDFWSSNIQFASADWDIWGELPILLKVPNYANQAPKIPDILRILRI
jgi:hypothetical protein